MFQIRSERTEDIPVIGEVNDAAFEGPNEAKLVAAIRNSEFFIPELSLVALSERVIGHILLSLISIETLNGSIPTLALAPMAVLPGFQNQGIGSAMVLEGLKRAAELGYDHATVLGHPDFYPKFGFVPSRTKGIHPPFPVKDEYFMVLELRENALTDIQGKVKYTPAFDAV